MSGSHIANPSGVSDDEFNRAMADELSDAVQQRKSAGLVQ